MTSVNEIFFASNIYILRYINISKGNKINATDPEASIDINEGHDQNIKYEQVKINSNK